MKVYTSGLIALNTSDLTIVFCRGKQAQHFPIPDGYTDIAIDPSMNGPHRDEGEIIFPGGSAYTLRLSPRFGRIEVTSLTQADFEMFIALLQSDPDVLGLLNALDQAINQFVSDLIHNTDKVLSHLPENGAAATFIRQLNVTNWEEIVAEVRAAAKAAALTKGASLVKGFVPQS